MTAPRVVFPPQVEGGKIGVAVIEATDRSTIVAAEASVEMVARPPSPASPAAAAAKVHSRLLLY